MGFHGDIWCAERAYAAKNRKKPVDFAIAFSAFLFYSIPSSSWVWFFQISWSAVTFCRSPPDDPFSGSTLMQSRFLYY